MSTDIQPTTRPCNFGGGTRQEYDGRSSTRPPCQDPATHRYHPHGAVDGHWNYRCAEHAALLAAGILVERLDQAGEAA